MKKRLSFISILLILLVFSLLPDGLKGQNKGELLEGHIRVSYIDVGQGDSAFIEFPGGKTALIDAGESVAAEAVIPFIEDYGYDTIDYIICTHPHSDHIGGMSKVIQAFQIGTVYMPKVSHTSKTFETLLLTIQEKGLGIHTAKAGVSIQVTPEITMEFLAPCNDYYEEMNNYSAVVRLCYGKNAFLFTGDAEMLSEDEILAEGYNVQAQVLKVGHHGSVTSTGRKFLQAVSPSFAVISSGKGNDYGHPHRETLALLKNKKIAVLRTDQQGTITFMSDGNRVWEVIK